MIIATLYDRSQPKEHNYILDTFSIRFTHRTILCALQHAPYLAKRTLNLSEKVVVRHLWCAIIHVIDSKLQLLHLLKVVVELKSMRKHGIQRVLDILRSTDLKAHVQSTTVDVC